MQAWIAVILVAAAVGVATTGGAAAQPYGTDVLATTTAGMLYRIPPVGTWSRIRAFTSTFPNMVAMDNDNRHAIVAAYQPGGLSAIDTQTGLTTRTLWSGPPIFRVDYFTPVHDGDFVVTGTTLPFAPAIFKVRPDGSAITTIRVGAPFRGLQAVLQDLVTGHLLAGDLTGTTLYDVAFDGTVTSVFSHAMFYPFSLTQDHTDGSILIGVGGRSLLWGVLRYDRAANRLTTPVAAGIVNNANAICFDRWAGNGEIVVGSGPVHRIASNGVVITTHSNLPWNNTGMCFDRGRNVVSRRVQSPNVWRFDLDFPGEGNRVYVLALSATGFAPGIAVGGRSIPLVPDAVFWQSVAGGLSSILVGNLAFLDARGQAFATLDLRAVGPGMSGTPFWVAAVTLDASAPSGVATISKPVVLVVD